MITLERERSLRLPEAAPPARQDWVDNLRTWIILLAVSMHCCVTYSHVGDWYFMSQPEPNFIQKLPFGLWEGHLQAFFMGLMFLIAGYYADRSLSRRGRKSFLSERFRRLGIPTLVYMLVIQPLILFVIHPSHPAPANLAKAYGDYVISGRFIGGTGPMWFAFALLIFSVVLAGVQPRIPRPQARPFELRAVHVLGLGFTLTLVTFLMRTVQPLGSSIINFQPCYFPQYLIAFPLGIWISRRNVLESIAHSPVARRAGICALLIGPPLLCGAAALSLPLPAHGDPASDGGWNLAAFAFAFWEQMTGVALAVGSMAYFARKFSVHTPFTRCMSERSFGVYMLHAPIIVLIALAVQPHRLDPYTMAIGLTLAGAAVSFLVTDGLRRISLIRQIL